MDEIQSLRNSTHTTCRETVDALEAAMYTAMPVLDHGFIRVVDYMGSDASIVQAARVSYGRGTKRKTEDAALIRYLMRHRHSTPFEMCEIKFHVKLPIFVARQWIRHRTANVNEYSARYSILDKEFYTPQVLCAQSQDNKQGRDEVLSADEAAHVVSLLKRDAQQCYESYEDMLAVDDDSRQGLARELARINLPVSFYTQWYWKIDLHNLFHFMALRGDSHAQYEIQAYVNVMKNLVSAWVPSAYKAFEDYRLNGAQLSGPALTLVRDRLQGIHKDYEAYGLSSREIKELEALLPL